MKLIILFFLYFLASTANAELSTKECRVAVGAEATQILGPSSGPAVRICTESPKSAPELHRLSGVWHSSNGVCYFLEEIEEYVNGRSYSTIPADTTFLTRLPSGFIPYSSFAPVCGPQDSPGYFPILTPIEDKKIVAIRAMWQNINMSDANFSKFAHDFKEATGGASSNWRRDKLQIRFLDLIEGDTPGWKRLLGIKKSEYILGLKDGCCELFMGIIDLNDEAAVIRSVVPSVH